MKLVMLTALFAGSLLAGTYTWWADACTPSAAEDTGCLAGDPELAKWALGAWEAASSGKVVLEPASAPASARLCYRWAAGRQDRYGETRPTLIAGEPGAEMFVYLRTEMLGRKISAEAKKDPLFRDSIVYLTCLHEAGHAFGLPHTADFDDIMYDFRNGGNIYEYFARFRRKLGTRTDIQKNTAISPNDIEALKSRLSSQATN